MKRILIAVTLAGLAGSPRAEDFRDLREEETSAASAKAQAERDRTLRIAEEVRRRHAREAAQDTIISACDLEIRKLAANKPARGTVDLKTGRFNAVVIDVEFEHGDAPGVIFRRVVEHRYTGDVATGELMPVRSEQVAFLEGEGHGTTYAIKGADGVYETNAKTICFAPYEADVKPPELVRRPRR